MYVILLKNGITEESADNMKHMKISSGRIIAIIGNILLGICILITVYAAVSAANGKVASVFGKSIMQVVSGSMEPTIYPGDYILVEKVSYDELEEGDIITFYSSDSSILGMPNTHRIAEINEDGSFVTKGDANSNCDETAVTSERVIGKYAGKLRFLRWVYSFSSLKKIILLTVIVVILIMSVYETKTIIKINRMTDEEKERMQAEKKEKLIREAIEKEKKRLYEENYSENHDYTGGDET
ncbi:MAG: signal peptidase I [Oscillospiraceae bacterium]|nr:signal peptidase I [Oscillospiraceae bacterium]